MAAHLGPLELVGDRWIIGDPKREGGSCLVLTGEGMEHHRPGTPEPLALFPWSIFVELGIRATYKAWHATRTVGILNGLGGGYLEAGRDGCSVGGIRRHPYEPWAVNYTHHERAYSGTHVHVVRVLFQRLSEARALHRLGDQEWLGAAVGQLASVRGGWALSMTRRAREAIENTGV